MAVLVLGGYGLIGSAIVEDLLRAGLPVIGLGRNVEAARRRWPDAEWRTADIGKLQAPDQWSTLLDGVDTVVNTAGVLQQGLRDDVEAVQERSMRALYLAARAAGVRRIVQVSSVGANLDASTAFLRTKARADEALRHSGLEFVILRPGLVISPVAYGGTAMLRGLAAFPGVTPLVFGRSTVQTCSVRDVAEAAVASVRDLIPSGTVFDLVERPERSLAETVRLFRHWLGAGDAVPVVMPDIVARATAVGADLLGWLGWRSPLRTTAMAVMRDGVSGAAGQAETYIGRPLRTLPETLASMPAGPQELWFARLWLAKPLIIATLSAFWLASGVIGFMRIDQAAAVLTDRGVSRQLADLAVLGGSVADVGLALLLLFRPSAGFALKAMVLVSLGYLAGASIFAPDLWLDPLGPLVKVVPAMMLALMGLAVLEER
jgi:uncharacterized protein YbjT (DUF2867 family)